MARTSFIYTTIRPQARTGPATENDREMKDGTRWIGRINPVGSSTARLDPIRQEHDCFSDATNVACAGRK
ncbi:hypothetical protein IFM47457_01805 [Aspergillus lentulus]|nr:hypothetical protein IFM47457_01805 [Aspergillus lentulus]